MDKKRIGNEVEPRYWVMSICFRGGMWQGNIASISPRRLQKRSVR